MNNICATSELFSSELHHETKKYTLKKSTRNPSKITFGCGICRCILLTSKTEKVGIIFINLLVNVLWLLSSISFCNFGRYWYFNMLLWYRYYYVLINNSQQWNKYWTIKKGFPRCTWGLIFSSQVTVTGSTKFCERTLLLAIMEIKWNVHQSGMQESLQ